MRACRTLAAAAALTLLGGLAAGCGGDDGTGETSGEVVATTTILGDLVAPVARACDLGVTTVIRAGVDPHGFAPSPRDGERLDAATIVVANGGGLEESLLDLLDATDRAGTPVFAALDHVDTLPAGHGADTGGENGAAADPHFWHDPTRVAAVVEAFGTALGAARADLAQCATRAARERADGLRALDMEIAAELEAVPPPHRRLVTDHDSFAYFADRYGFEIVGSVIPSTSSLAQASASDLEELADAIEAAGVHVVFSDAAGSRRLAETLAGEVDGVDVVALHSDALGDGVDTYEELMRTNADAIAGALAP